MAAFVTHDKPAHGRNGTFLQHSAGFFTIYCAYYALRPSEKKATACGGGIKRVRDERIRSMKMVYQRGSLRCLLDQWVFANCSSGILVNTSHCCAI